MIPEKLWARVKRDENCKLTPYQDTEGIWTVGYGHNCQTKRIRQEVAELLLKHDMEDAEHELVTALPWIEKLDEPRRAVFIDMCYNMGLRGLLSFKNTLAYAATGDWEKTAAGIRASKYYRQTKDRGERNAVQIETGEWQ